METTTPKRQTSVMVRLNESSAAKLARLAHETGVPASTLAHMATQAMINAYWKDRHLAIPLTMTLHGGDISMIRREQLKREIWERMYPGRPYNLPYGLSYPEDYLAALAEELDAPYTEHEPVNLAAAETADDGKSKLPPNSAPRLTQSLAEQMAREKSQAAAKSTPPPAP